MWGVDSGVPTGSRSPHAKRQFLGETTCPGMPDNTAVRYAKLAEPIEVPFELWTRVGPRKHKFNRIRQVAPMCTHGKAHLRHLANTTEPSVCCDDAALSQIALTACYYRHHHNHAVQFR